jgi:hypothetical protein
LSRSSKAGIGVVLTLVLAFGVWWFGFRADAGAVFPSAVPAVKVTPLRPPQYVAELTGPDPGSPGLVARAGGDLSRLLRASQGVWLDDGRLLVSTYRRHDPCKFHGNDAAQCLELVAEVLDPRTGRTSVIPGLDGLSWSDMPGEALHRVTVTTAVPSFDVPLEIPVMLRADLSAPEMIRLPEYPGNGDVNRNTSRRIFSIGDWDYVRYSDNDGEDATESYGYLRRRTGSKSWHKVLVNQRLVALWISGDGRALLGLQQKHGEPCGGCTVKQQIVEIDPVHATIAGVYGVPKPYDKTWRVATIDKVGDRVLVRFFSHGNVIRNRGVWAYDGHWSLVPGSTGPFTWWQGPKDRIEARLPAVPPKDDDYYFELYWVHGTKATRLPGRLRAVDAPGWRGAPGSLVPLK